MKRYPDNRDDAEMSPEAISLDLRTKSSVRLLKDLAERDDVGDRFVSSGVAIENLFKFGSRRTTLTGMLYQYFYKCDFYCRELSAC